MNQKDPFSKLSPLAAPASFKASLYQRMTALERRARTWKISSLVAASAASLAGLVGACAYVWQSIGSSGFGHYIALMFSDSAAFAYWRELGYALVESLPSAGIAFALTAGLLSVWSLWSFARVFQSRGEGVRQIAG